MDSKPPLTFNLEPSPISTAELNICSREVCFIKLQIFLVWPFTTPSTPAFLPMSCKLCGKSASSDWVSDSAAKQSRNIMLLSKHTVCYKCVAWPSPVIHWDGTGCQQNTWAGKTVTKFNPLDTVSTSSLLKRWWFCLFCCCLHEGKFVKTYFTKQWLRVGLSNLFQYILICLFCVHACMYVSACTAYGSQASPSIQWLLVGGVSGGSNPASSGRQ